MKLKDKPIVVEHTFNASTDIIWDAITNVKKMKQWFFENIKDFKPEVGFETKFNVVSGDRNFMHIWKITEVQPLKKITYHWNYEGYEGDTFVHFELFGQENNTLLRVTTEITEDFTLDIPEFKRESCEGGWNYFIKESLKNYLKKNTT